MLRAIFAVTIAAAAIAQAQPISPYAVQQQREIKALSTEDIEGYLEGKGMGLARAAELNGYPGPMHVLELADRLELTPEQRGRTEALFARMRSQAIAAGQGLVEEERALDELFRSKRATPAAVATALERIATRQAEVRRSHLDAHLAQIAILRPEQVRRYHELRGYTNESGSAGGHRHHRH